MPWKKNVKNPDLNEMRKDVDALGALLGVEGGAQAAGSERGPLRGKPDRKGQARELPDNRRRSAAGKPGKSAA